MSTTFRCENCGIESDEKPTVIRFSYTLMNGAPGVELIYLCSGCSSQLPKTNPNRRLQLVQLFKSLYPNRQIKME
ncbi:MAG: hypothetical protein JXP73_12990 [Deltaproteobacteria bacterium]|nr:hypothetical protein [Deltaproteobacteria bacterium]